MNMDTSKPTPAMKEKARIGGINLSDVHIQEEFRCMQLQNLEDMKRMVAGKRVCSESEIKQERAKILTRI